MAGEECDILIIGGGPAGLACATELARSGAKVVLAERKPRIGPKVCAGGITWHGVLRHVPPDLIEARFPQQHVHTPWQQVVVAEPDPIVATVNRDRLGQWMANQAQAAGVIILTSTRVVRLEQRQATVETPAGQRRVIGFGHLVGADGSNSLVRRFLDLPVQHLGLGLNVMVPHAHPRMEWHLVPQLFGCGYAWIFPHHHETSIGAYADVRACSAKILTQRFLQWARIQGLGFDPRTIRAGLVNYDYRGLRFGQVFLAGDAAGLASGLTGEGIYPALVSGQMVARLIASPEAEDQVHSRLNRLVRKHRHHQMTVALSRRHPRFGGWLAELAVLLLRMKVIAFRSLEMAE